MNPLHVGSTRLRIFKALHRFPDGLTVAQIREKTDISANSGGFFDVLREEQAAKRIRKIHVYAGPEERKTAAYVLTAKGQKAFDEKEIDRNAYAGRRIGIPWSKNRHKSA